MKTVTCSTTDCRNEGVPIDVPNNPDSLVICGACGEPIRNITSDYDDEAVEVPPWLI